LVSALISAPFPYTTLFRSFGSVDSRGHAMLGYPNICQPCLFGHAGQRGRLAGWRLRHGLGMGVPRRVREAEIGQHVVDMSFRRRSEEHTSELQSREKLVCR